MHRSPMIGLMLLSAALAGCPEPQTTCETDSDCPEGAYCSPELELCFTRELPDAGTITPATPTGLSATPTRTQVVLTWKAGSEADLAKYDLYWGTRADALDQTASVAAPEASHKVTGLAEATTYFFAIEAENTAGQTSPRSAVLAVTTLSTQSPPDVIFTVPAEGAVGVSRDTSITVAFSKPMNAEATEAAFGITSPTGFDTGTFSWNGDRTEMTFHAAADFPYGATVAFRVSTSAQDTNGNNLLAELNRSFRIIQFVRTTVYSTAALDGGVCQRGICYSASAIDATSGAIWVGRDTAGYGSGIMRLVLSFDLKSLSPAPSAIISAELAMFHSRVSGTVFDTGPSGLGPLVIESVTYGPALVESAFDGAVNIQPITGQPLATTFPEGAGYQRVDVTAFVLQDWTRSSTNGKRSQMRVRFAQDLRTQQDSVLFAEYTTGDHASNKPYLTISYEYP